MRHGVNYRQEAIQEIIDKAQVPYSDAITIFNKMYKQLLRSDWKIEKGEKRTINVARELYYNIKGVSDRYSTMNIDLKSGSITSVYTYEEILRRDMSFIAEAISSSDNLSDAQIEMMLGNLEQIIQDYTSGKITRKEFQKQINEYKQDARYLAK